MSGILPPEVWTSEHAYPEFAGHEYHLLEHLECPAHLPSLDFFDEPIQDRFCDACGEGLAFLIEQCCDNAGKLLPKQIWETRVKHAPLELLHAWHQFMRETDTVVLGQVVYFVFWYVRFARVERTGSADLVL